MYNKDVKLAMFEENLKQFELALLLGIHEGNLSKKLNRRELSNEEKERILKVIRERRKQDGECKFYTEHKGNK